MTKLTFKNPTNWWWQFEQTSTNVKVDVNEMRWNRIMKQKEKFKKSWIWAASRVLKETWLMFNDISTLQHAGSARSAIAMTTSNIESQHWSLCDCSQSRDWVIQFINYSLKIELSYISWFFPSSLSAAVIHTILYIFNVILSISLRRSSQPINTRVAELSRIIKSIDINWRLCLDYWPVQPSRRRWLWVQSFIEPSQKQNK